MRKEADITNIERKIKEKMERERELEWKKDILERFKKEQESTWEERESEWVNEMTRGIQVIKGITPEKAKEEVLAMKGEEIKHRREIAFYRIAGYWSEAVGTPPPEKIKDFKESMEEFIEKNEKNSLELEIVKRLTEGKEEDERKVRKWIEETFGNEALEELAKKEFEERQELVKKAEAKQKNEKAIEEKEK